MPRLTPEEYKRACDMGYNPDTLTLDQLGRVRSYRRQEPVLKGLEQLKQIDGVMFAGSLDEFLDDVAPAEPRTMGYQPELLSVTPEPPPRPTFAPE